MTVTSEHSTRELTPEQGRELLDRQAHKLLGISGSEFASAWERGEFDDDPDRPEVMRLVMLLPLAG